MSLSYRKAPRAGRARASRLDAGFLCAAASLLLAAPAVFAAEYSFQPIATLSAENDSNIDLDPGPARSVQGYSADVAALVGIETPDFTATIKPRLVYRDYPEDNADDRLEEHLDFNTYYRTLRSTTNFLGAVERLDEFNAEFTAAVFDEINPTQTAVQDTGRVVNGGTRDSVILAPTYSYKLTPIMSIGATGSYQAVNYSPTDPTSHIDFDYYVGKGFMSWAFSQQSTVTFGGFGTKYQATKIESDATGSGATVDLETVWNPVLSTDASVVYQHTNVDVQQPAVFTAAVNTWGATATVLYKTQTSQFRLYAGRTIDPTGGSLYVVEQLKFQYDRNLSERLTVTGAVVGQRLHALTENVAGTDRNYTQELVELHWMMTQTWFVQGGYQFSWQKYEFDPSGASNNRVYVMIGYKGRPPQR